MNANLVITEAYKQEQALLHSRGNYGTTGRSYGPLIGALVARLSATSLLDYGCGSRRSLLETLRLPDGVVYEGYDPAVPDYSDEPIPAELVCCVDVLEHIEPHLLGNVLKHLASLCDPYGFFTIHTGPAQKTLSDGRNAHLIQQPVGWWLPHLQEHFQVLLVREIANGFCVLVRTSGGEQLPLPQGVEALFDQYLPGAVPKQIAAKAGLAQRVVEHEGKRMVFNTPNEMTAWRVKSIFQKEPDTIRWLSAIPAGSVLVDVGANVGMYSIFAAVAQGARVFAFEPESQNFALLNSNIAANSMSDKVIAYPMALGDRMQVDKLYLSDFSAGGSCHSFGEEVGFDLKPRAARFTQGCISVTLDQLVDSGVVPQPEFIKLDVDGFEHKVIDGGQKTLSNPKLVSVIVELNTHLQEHRDVVEKLRSLGFDYDESQVQGALRKSGAFEGVGEFIFKRSVRKQPPSTFGRTYQFALPRHARGRQILTHVLRRVAETEVTRDPYPYLVVDDIFPADYYREMLSHFPTHESLRPLGETGRVPKGQYAERLTVLFTEEDFSRMTAPQQAFWRDFADWMYTDQFLSAFVSKFSTDLEPRLSNILRAEESLKVKGDALLVNDQTRYAIGPHTDAPHRLVSFLFYLPADDSMRELGTSIYRHNDPEFVCWGGPHYPFDNFTRVKTVEFLPNRLMAFPKTERSFHGVESIERLNVSRPLLINNVRLLNKTTH